MHGSFAPWLIFLIIIFFLLAFDLGVLHRKDHEMKLRESLMLSAFYICIGLLYGVGIWLNLGSEQAHLYFAGFIVEKTLSLDNIFVISVILTQLHIPALYQYRVLFFGIIGALILRGIMIGAGSVLIAKFEWVLYIFAAFLILTGFKLFFLKEKSKEIRDNKLYQFLKKYLPLTHEMSRKFWLRQRHQGKVQFQFTPLFLALCLIEAADIIFAFDSIPAIFAITTDTYLVYTSNIFAILGLRALFFSVHSIIRRFYYLKFVLAIILIFIGSKVFLQGFFDFHFAPSVSLLIIFSLIALGILFSLYKNKSS